MKKKIVIMAAGMMLIGALTACAGQADSQTTQAKSTAAATTEATTAAAEEDNSTAQADSDTEAPVEAPDEASGDTESDGQNPVMNFIGIYSCDRASIQVEAKGKDEALFTINWSSSAFEHCEWVMSGKLDLDKLTVDYSDGVKRTIVYTSEGELDSDNVDYEDGSGTFTFSGNTVTWKDNKEGAADGMVFEFGPAFSAPDEAGE